MTPAARDGTPRPRLCRTRAMNTYHRLFTPARGLAAAGTVLAALALLAAPAGLRAQDAPPAAAADSAPAAAPASAGPTLAGDVLFPYAFRFNRFGFVGDAGGVIDGAHFVGLEFSYFDANPKPYAWYSNTGAGPAFGGDVPYRDDLYTLNAAYRYTTPIPVGGNPRLLDFYVGGSMGVAWLEYTPYGTYYPTFAGAPGWSRSDRGRLDLQGVAGFDVNFSRNVGLRLGYRYIYVNSANVFYTATRVDSGALEGGLTFRF